MSLSCTLMYMTWHEESLHDLINYMTWVSLTWHDTWLPYMIHDHFETCSKTVRHFWNMFENWRLFSKKVRKLTVIFEFPPLFSNFSSKITWSCTWSCTWDMTSHDMTWSDSYMSFMLHDRPWGFSTCHDRPWDIPTC